MAAKAATQASRDWVMYREADKTPMVYILASKPNGTIYVGVTSDLYGRMRSHREGTFKGFTSKYGVKTLVYFEMHTDMDSAIKRESQLKKWQRLWKIRLIEQMNPTWSDLFDEENGIAMVGPAGQSLNR